MKRSRLSTTAESIYSAPAEWRRSVTAECGIVAPVGRRGVDRLLEVIEATIDARVPAAARQCLQIRVAQLKLVKQHILDNDRQVLGLARSTELGRCLMEVPGIGPLVTSALIACVPDPVGLPMRPHHGSVDRRGPTPKFPRRQGAAGVHHQGRQSLSAADAVRRRMAVIRRAMQSTRRTWLVRLLDRRKPKVAAIALANKNARIAWAMMVSGDRYHEPRAIAA